MTTIKAGGVPEHFNLPWHLAIENNAFEKAGIQVEWEDQPSGTGAMTGALNEGELDVAVVLTEGMTADIIKGGQGRILQFFVESPLRWGIHVAADSSFQTVSELEGKRFAITRYGSGSHLMAYINAHRMGWDPRELEWVVVGGMDGAREALANDKADVYMCEQFTTQFLVDQQEFRRVGTCDTPWPCFVVSARQEFLDQHPEALRNMLDVINAENKRFMDREDAISLVSQRYDMRPEQVREWYGMTRWATSSRIDHAVLENVEKTLYELELIPSLPDPDSLCSDLASRQA